MSKVQVAEIKVGDVVKGLSFMKAGFHTVAEIRSNASHMKNTSTELRFIDADGDEFFVGRMNAKATIQD